MKTYRKASGYHIPNLHDGWSIWGRDAEDNEELIAVVNTETLANAVLAALRQESRKVRVVVNLCGGVVNEVVHDDPDIELELVFLGSDSDCQREQEVLVDHGYFADSYIYTTASSNPAGHNGTGCTLDDIDEVFACGEVYESL